MPPSGSAPLADLPSFAMTAAPETLDEIARCLYDFVREAGGKPAGQGKGVYQFTLGSAQAWVDLDRGWARVWSDAEPETREPTDLEIKLGRAIPPAVTIDEFDCPDAPPADPVKPLREGLVWQIKPYSDPIEFRLQDMNAAIAALRRLAWEYRTAVDAILAAKKIRLFARMDSTSDFVEVHPDAVPGVWLDWEAMRLHLPDGKKPEQVMFSPVIGRRLGPGQPTIVMGEVQQRVVQIAEAILDEYPRTWWSADEVIALMLEHAPAADRNMCRNAFQLAKAKLQRGSPWLKGGRPSAKVSLSAAMRIHLIRRGLERPG
jgi:hypothetical protein